MKAGKVQGNHPVVSFNTLIKHFFCTKIVFLAFFFIGLLIQQAAVWYSY